MELIKPTHTHVPWDTTASKATCVQGRAPMERTTMPSVLGTQENVNHVQEITLMMRLAKRNVNSAVKVLREVKGVIPVAVKGKTVFSR